MTNREKVDAIQALTRLLETSTTSHHTYLVEEVVKKLTELVNSVDINVTNPQLPGYPILTT